MNKSAIVIMAACSVLCAFLCPGVSAKTTRANEKAAIEKTIRASIGWALTKDRPLLESVLAHDDGLFMFQPDSKSTIVGFEAFKALGERAWMKEAFKATDFAVRDLRINVSGSGSVAWYSCFLDDHAEWNGQPIGWDNARWTGVLEKRNGKWIIVQMHFSFARD